VIASCTRSGNRKPFPGKGTCLAPGMEATVKRVLKTVLVLTGALFVVPRTETLPHRRRRRFHEYVRRDDDQYGDYSGALLGSIEIGASRGDGRCQRPRFIRRQTTAGVRSSSACQQLRDGWRRRVPRFVAHDLHSGDLGTLASIASEKRARMTTVQVRRHKRGR